MVSEQDINWGAEASPFYGCKITWYLTHNNRVLVWRGGDQLINHQQVMIEGDDEEVLSDGSTRPSRSYTEWEESILITPRYNKVALGDAVVTAAKYYGIDGRINLIVDRKHADHIVVSLVQE